MCSPLADDGEEFCVLISFSSLGFLDDPMHIAVLFDSHFVHRFLSLTLLSHSI